MSQIGLLSLTETVLEADDPVIYSFKPTGFAAPNVVDYVNASGVPDSEQGPALPAIGQPRIRFTTVRATATRNAKVTIQIDTPILALTSPSTASGVEPSATRAYNPIFKAEFFLPRQSGTASRSRLLTLARMMLQQDVVEEAVVNSEHPW